MTAAVYDLKLEQGEDFTPLWQFRWPGSQDPVDLTGWTAHIQIRSTYYASAILADLTIANGGVTLGGVLGTIQWNLPATMTAAMIPAGAPSPTPVWQKINGRPYTKVGVYDVRLYPPSGKVMPIVGGNVYVSPSVTRAP
jgi:hypothetical protein